MDMKTHLLARHYDTARYPTQWMTETTLTVPLFDFAHRLKGYQTYTPGAPKTASNPKEARYFTRGFGTQHVWGLELEISNVPTGLPH